MSEYCYWECSGDPDHEPPWKGSCGGQSYEIEDDYMYCPYCGKPICEIGMDFRPPLLQEDSDE